MTLTPQIDGTVAIHASALQFVQAFQQRVAAGLLAGQPHPRSNYRVVKAWPDQLRVHAADWWTAINVGLNEFCRNLPVGPPPPHLVREFVNTSWVGNNTGR